MEADINYELLDHIFRNYTEKRVFFIIITLKLKS